MAEKRENPFLTHSEQIEVPEEVFDTVDPLLLLKSEVDEIQKSCFDIAGIVDSVYFKEGVLKAEIYDNKKEKVYNDYSFSNHAFSQLCNKMGVPARYMIKCMGIDSKRHLVLDNMNEWLQDQDTEMLVRTVRGNFDYPDKHIRGILSSRYSILDAPDVLDVLIDVFKDTDYPLQLKGSLVNDERFHARIIDPTPIGVDDLFFGLQIDTSDVGISNLSVHFLIYKQVCTNGLVVSKFGGEIYRQKHVGITPVAFKRELVANLEGIPALADQMKNRIILLQDEKLKPSDLKLGDEMSRLMLDFKNKTDVSDKILERVVDLVPQYGTNRWGLINAVTDVAQSFPLDRRMQLENYASHLLMVA